MVIDYQADCPAVFFTVSSDISGGPAGYVVVPFGVMQSRFDRTAGRNIFILDLAVDQFRNAPRIDRDNWSRLRDQQFLSRTREYYQRTERAAARPLTPPQRDRDMTAPEDPDRKGRDADRPSDTERRGDVDRQRDTRTDSGAPSDTGTRTDVDRRPDTDARRDADPGSAARSDSDKASDRGEADYGAGKRSEADSDGRGSADESDNR